MSSCRTSLFDLAIIGGGINGCGIARDAAGRGLSVLLVEQGDLAGATSSASTKLIHGGLRYLEHYAFRLVHEALAEREVLLRAAPHIIRPMRFMLPHHAGLRPWWLIRTGPVPLRPSWRPQNSARHHDAGPAQGSSGRPAPNITRGFEYSDCSVDDSRLVILNARDAAARGADIRTRTRCLGARRADGVWHLTLEGGATDDRPRPGERRRALVSPCCRVRRDAPAPRPPGERQPHRRASPAIPTNAATSSRTPTAGSVSRSRTSTTSR